MPDPSPDAERHARIAQVKQDWAQRLLANPNVVAVGHRAQDRRRRGHGGARDPGVRAPQAAGRPGPARRAHPRRDRRASPRTSPSAETWSPWPRPVDALGAIGVLDARANPVKHAHAKTAPDDDSHRPLTGGRQIAPVDSDGYVGTLGCLLWDPADHDVGYALTNMHVVKPPDVTTITKNVSKIGQPDGNDSSSKCCNDVIGVFAGGGNTADRDEALVQAVAGPEVAGEDRGHRARRRRAPAHPGRGHRSQVQGRQAGPERRSSRAERSPRSARPPAPRTT